MEREAGIGAKSSSGDAPSLLGDGNEKPVHFGFSLMKSQDLLGMFSISSEGGLKKKQPPQFANESTGTCARKNVKIETPGTQAYLDPLIPI